MNLNSVFKPIKNELDEFEKILLKQVDILNDEKKYFSKVIKYFFQSRGKYLRPGLVFLSGKALIGENQDKINKLTTIATAIELIHSATLIHDDMVDRSDTRRGQLAMNKKYNNPIAVLGGDYLFARAFKLLSSIQNYQVLEIVVACIERMCQGEINELITPSSTFEDYINLIISKTAVFMEASCQCGALLGDANVEDTMALGEFGENFGITYQLLDDKKDGDIDIPLEIDYMEQAEIYSKKAKKNLSALPNSKYKDSLFQLIDLILVNNQ